MSNSRDTEIGTNMSETLDGEGTMDPSNQSNKNKDQILDTPLHKEKRKKGELTYAEPTEEIYPGETGA